MQNKLSFVVLLPVFLFYSIAARAIEIIEPVQGEAISIPAKFIEYIDDPEDKISIEDIVSGRAGDFKPATKTNHGFGHKGSMWIRMNIDFSKLNKSKLFLINSYFHSGSLTVFVNNGGVIEIAKETEHKLLSERKYAFNEYIFSVERRKKDIQEVYVKIEPEHHALRMEFEITDEEGLVKKVGKEQFVLGLFFGSLLILLFYNMVIYLYLRNKSYLFYIYYLTSFIIIFWYLSGYAPVFTPVYRVVDSIYTIFAYTAIHGLLLFARSFLILKGKYRSICKFLEYVSVLGIIGIFVLPINAFIILNLLLMISMLFLAYAGAQRLREGFRPALIYLMGWFAFSVTGIAYALRSLGFTELTVFSKYGIMISSVWEAVFFALALAYSFKLLEKQNIKSLTSMLDKKIELNKTVRDFEEFKNEIGQELHDELGQRMVALKYAAKMLEGNITIENANRLGKDIGKSVNEIQNEIDNILDGLRPPLLQSLGLSGAIQSIIDDHTKVRFEHQYQATIDKNIDDRIEPAIQLAIFRIAQESITNVIRHANATSVSVYVGITNTCTHLQYSENCECLKEGITRVEARIIDNGQGFDLPNTRLGQGLIGMKQRVDVLFGIFKVESKIGKGTVVMISIPCESKKCISAS